MIQEVICWAFLAAQMTKANACISYVLGENLTGDFGCTSSSCFSQILCLSTLNDVMKAKMSPKNHKKQTNRRELIYYVV